MHKSVRILLSFSFVIVLMTITGIFGRGVQAAEQHYNQAATSWQGQVGAARYNVYYKESGMTSWQHSVRDLASNASSITIGYLKPGVSYWYRVSAEDESGKEFWWSANMKLNTMMSNTPMPMTQTQPSSMPSSTPQAMGPTTSQSGSWTQATIHWVPNGNAQYYNIYYKEAGQSSYMYSVPNVPGNASTLTINGLKSASKYFYNVASFHDSKEYWMGEKVLSWGAPKVEVVSLSSSMMLPDPTTFMAPAIPSGTMGSPSGLPQQPQQVPASNDSINDSGLPTNSQGNEPVYKY